MTCDQGPCDVPAYLATHDCLDRPLSGWEVRSVLGVVLPLLILATPRNKKRGLVVLPKGDMSPYLMMKVAHTFSACMPLTVLVEDEALALRTLDEEEESPVERKYPVEFVCESLAQHAKHTTGEYDACLLLDYTAKPDTTKVVPYVTKICKMDARVAHVSRAYRNSDTNDEELATLWKETVRGAEDILNLQMGQVTGALIQTYVNLLRRPNVYGSVIAGNNVNNAVGVVLGMFRDTSRRIRAYESYYDPSVRHAVFETERSAAEHIQGVMGKMSESSRFLFLPPDYEDWIKKHTARVEAVPGAHKFRTFPSISKEVLDESVGVQQLLRGAVRAGPEAQTGGSRSDGGEDVRPGSSERT